MRFVTLWLTIVLVGCQYSPTLPIRLGAADQLSNAPLFLADMMGWYAPDKVRLVKLPSSSEVIHQLRSGNLEAAALSLNEALQLVYEGVPLTIFLITGQPESLDGLVVQRDIKSLSDLRGRNLAMENSALSIDHLSHLTRSAGFRTAQINIRPVSLEKHLNALSQENIQGLLTTEPVLTLLQQRNFSILERIDYRESKLINVLVIKTEAVDVFAPQLTEIARVYFETLEHLKETRNQSIELLARSFELDQRVISRLIDNLGSFSLQQNHQTLAQENKVLQEILSTKQTMLTNLGYSRASNNLAEIEFSAQWLPSL